MTPIISEIILLELEAMKLKKLLIEKYAGYDDPVSQIITKDARNAIKEIQSEIQYFVTI